MPINRNIRYETAGDNNSYSQAFYNNYYANNIPVINDFFSFYKPQFYTYGGTLNYYGQDPFAIFTNTVNPAIRFIFTGNSESLSGDSYFVHRIYKIDYPTFKLYGDNQLGNSLQITNTQSKSSGSNLASNGTIPSKELTGKSNVKTGNNVIPQPDKFFGGKVQGADFNTIQSYFTTPLLTITASTSAVTGFVYDLYLSQYVKQLGKFKEELFEDKAQYFIDTQIVFNTTLGKNYANYFSLDSGGNSSFPWNDNLKIAASNSFEHTISAGTFSGVSVMGNYFAYFTVPDKPALELIGTNMSGQMSSYSLSPSWSNGDEADSFLVQVCYNNVINTGFTGTVFNYPIEKTSENVKVISEKIKTPTTETVVNRNIYNCQISLKSNSQFIYRVGNSKEFIDIFGIRRVVVSFSEPYTATTQVNPIRYYTETESDSGYMAEIAGLDVPYSLDYETTGSTIVLSGIVSNLMGVLSGATVQLNFPSSTFYITTTTNGSGYYEFDNLPTGLFVETFSYRGFQSVVENVDLLGDTNMGAYLKLLAGDAFDAIYSLGTGIIGND